ncbi:MAG: hypothetical protein MZU91_12065 [Desulfosudis oleivorans]|nr:hypothetical protein [Desulfosudis oleivorans]
MAGRARLRARPVLDPGAVPGLRHRRVARRAEDERHHAGHRPRRAPAWWRPRYTFRRLFLAGRDGAAGRRGGLRACCMLIDIPVIRELAIDRQPSAWPC